MRSRSYFSWAGDNVAPYILIHLQSAKSTTIGSTWIILTLHYQVRQLSGKCNLTNFKSLTTNL